MPPLLPTGRQAGPRRSAGGCTLTLQWRLQNQARWLCLFTDAPLGASVRAGSEELGEEEGAQLTLPGLSKPKFFAIPASTVLLLVFSFPLGICTIWEAGFSMREPLVLYRGKLGFSGSPVWCLLPYFLSSIYASGPGRHHLLGCQRAATPALGPRAVEPPWRGAQVSGAA